MKVFKYCGDFGANVLEERRIKLSRAHLLNDPFELSPVLDPKSFTVSKAEKFLRQDQQIEHWYGQEGREKGFTNKKRYRDWYLPTLLTRAEAMMLSAPKNVEDVQRRFAEIFSNHCRLFCVSRIPDSILMWSHYAKEHAGLVLEFDFSQSPFDRLGDDWIVPVNYSESKASFDCDPGSKDDQFLRALRPVVATKSKEWSYEKEIRAIFPATACSSDDFIDVSPQSVRRVILGCRSTPSFESRVRNALRAPCMAHVALERATQSKDSFRLEFEPLL